MGSLLGSPGPRLAAFSPQCMCRAVYCAGSGSLAQGAPGVRHSSAGAATLWKGGQRISPQSQSFFLPLGSQTYLLSLSHVISPGPDGSCLQFSMFPHL